MIKNFEEFINESVYINTRAWQTNSKKSTPSGKGTWFFLKGSNVDMDPEKEGEDFFKYSGDYKDAKKKAEEWATKRNLSTIYLGY